MGGRNESGGRTGRADGNEPIRAVADTGDRGGGGAKDEDDGRSTTTLTRQEEETFGWSRGCRPDEGMIFGVNASVPIDRSSSITPPRVAAARVVQEASHDKGGCSGTTSNGRLWALQSKATFDDIGI